ncbi:MAG: glycosyltransferase, partial [Phycisphaerae bacterium]
MSEYSREQLESQDWFNYAFFYDKIARKEGFKRFVELGCWKGHSLRYLARRLRERGGSFELYGVDLWEAAYLREHDPDSCDDPDTLYKIYSTNLTEARVRDLVTDIRACSWESADQFENGSVDFVYIDADHAYESVVKDIRAWLPKVRRGGVISGHDYFTYPSVRRAVDEAFGIAVQATPPVWYVEIGAPTRGLAMVRTRLTNARARAERRRRALLGARRERQMRPVHSRGDRFSAAHGPWRARADHITERLDARAARERSAYEDACGVRPWVDVITLIHNEYEYLIEALESVLDQTCGLLRLTLVDNGSTRSETIELLEGLRLLRSDALQVISNEPPHRVVDARNFGVRKTACPYILMLDADDTLDPTCVEVMLNALQAEPLLGAVYSDWRLFGERDQEIVTPAYSLPALLRENYMTVTSMYRRELFDLVNGYSREMEEGYEDWEFWIKLAEAGWFARKAPGFLLNVRVKPRSRNAAAVRSNGRLVNRIRRLHPALYHPAGREGITRLWNRPRHDPAGQPRFAPLSIQPLVSVVIPCYNYGRYVGETVESVLEQTYENVEIIICDDGSPDEYTRGILDAIDHPKVTVFRQPNQGLAQSRNNAIGMARGELILPLDADDVILPEMIEHCVSAIQQEPDIGFVYTDILFFDEEHGVHWHRPYNFYLELGNNHATVCAMFRKEAWRQAGGYNPNMREGMEDWNFWVSLGNAYMIGKLIPRPLFAYRMHGASMSTETIKHRARLISCIRTNHPALYRPDSADAVHLHWNKRIFEDRARERPCMPADGSRHVSFEGALTFTIVIPSCGHGQYLDRCLASVFHQTDGDYELIIVEDGHGDPQINRRLREVAERRSNVTVLFNETNQGISKTLNRAIKHARGEYICMLDCDDELVATALERLRVCIESGPRKHFISTQRINIDHEGNVLNVVGRDESPADLLHGNHAGHLKAVHRDVFVDLGGYHSLFDGCQDYEHVLRVQESRPITYLNEPLYRYRWHQQTQSFAWAEHQAQKSDRVRRYVQFRHFLRDPTVQKGRLFGLIVVSPDAETHIDPAIGRHFNLAHVRIDSDAAVDDPAMPHAYRTKLLATLGDDALRGRFVYIAHPQIRLTSAALSALFSRLLSVPRAASATGRLITPEGADAIGSSCWDAAVPEDRLDSPAPWEYVRLNRPFRWIGVLYNRGCLSEMLAAGDLSAPLPGAPDGYLYAPDARLVLAPERIVRSRLGRH